MKILEREIQKAVLDYLQYLENQRKCYCFRAGSGAFKTQDGGYFKTGKPGCPDIVCCFGKGRFVSFEVKRPKTKQTASQREAEGRIKTLGGEYYVVRNVDDVQEIIK